MSSLAEDGKEHLLAVRTAVYRKTVRKMRREGGSEVGIKGGRLK